MTPLPLRAPREDRQVLAVPPFTDVAALLAQNERILSNSKPFLNELSLQELRRLARREIAAASVQYHQDVGQPVEMTTTDRWFVAGHQPELFHPGVWFKNFVLHELARRNGAMSLNLVIDTDTAKSPWLHVPGESRVLRVPFDRSAAELPYEEREVADEATFAELAARVGAVSERWGFTPMLASFWRDVMAEADRTKLVGECFAAARRRVERRWGMTQREVPMSRVCQTSAFATFAIAILERLPEFVAIYNQTVREYRIEQGIKSHSHPVPDLAIEGEWMEAPFWAWRTRGGRRGRLLVHRTPSEFQLRVGEEDWPALRGDPVAALQELEKRGYKIRSRALTTTMFARLFVADLFLHGVGGGIYDALTDRIIQLFFGITAPAYQVVSATLLLPLPRFPDAVSRCRELKHKVRDLIYKPEGFLGSNPMIEPMVRAKRSWIERSSSTHLERVERFQHIRELNARLQPFVSSESQRAERELAERQEQAERHEVAARRDYAFCLYPEEMLQQFFQAALT